jgi:hypothetical protein
VEEAEEAEEEATHATHHGAHHRKGHLSRGIETRIIEEAAERAAAAGRKVEEEEARQALAGLSELLQKKQAEQQGRLPESHRATQVRTRSFEPRRSTLWHSTGRLTRSCRTQYPIFGLPIGLPSPSPEIPAHHSHGASAVAPDTEAVAGAAGDRGGG